MKRTVFVSGLLVCLLTSGSIFVSCNNGSNDANTYDPIVYESAKGDTTYKLELTKNTSKKAFTPAGGDSFKMTITKTGGRPQISRGSIQSVSGNTFTLAHKSGGTFTVIASASAGMTDISGTIPIDDSTTPITAPGAVTPKSGEPGDPTPGDTDVKMAGTTWKGESDNQYGHYVGIFNFSTSNFTLSENVTGGIGEDYVGDDHGNYTVKGNSVTLTWTSYDGVDTFTVNNNTFDYDGKTYIKQ